MKLISLEDVKDRLCKVSLDKRYFSESGLELKTKKLLPFFEAFVELFHKIVSENPDKYLGAEKAYDGSCRHRALAVEYEAFLRKGFNSEQAKNTICSDADFLRMIYCVMCPDYSICKINPEYKSRHFLESKIENPGFSTIVF